jgi:hypothetical protein
MVFAHYEVCGSLLVYLSCELLMYGVLGSPIALTSIYLSGIDNEDPELGLKYYREE